MLHDGYFSLLLIVLHTSCNMGSCALPPDSPMVKQDLISMYVTAMIFTGQEMSSLGRWDPEN